MSATFLAASVQTLTSSPLVTAYPYSKLFWMYPGAGGVTLAALALDNGTETILVYTNGTNWRFYSGAGGATDCGDSTTINAWYFACLRCISATNQRLHILEPSGTIASAQHTTSMASPLIGGLTTLGDNPPFSNAPWTGRIAEWCDIAADIQPDGGVIDSALLRQLAYRGPFSVPHIKKDIIEYRSFRTHPTRGGPDEAYSGRRGVQTWTNVNGVTVGPHPPLPSGYVYPKRVGDQGFLSFAVDEGDATVTISGAATEGSTLTATFNDDDPDGPATGISYQWEADGTPIGGATSSTYQLTPSEVGKTVTVVVGYTDGEGFPESIESDPTGVITAVVTLSLAKNSLMMMRAGI